MEVKLIPGETEAVFIMRCIEKGITLSEKTERTAATECYHEWVVQNMEEIKSIKDVDLARKKYDSFRLGINLKTN